MKKKVFNSLCVTVMALAVFVTIGLSQEKKESDSAHKIVHSGGCDRHPKLVVLDLTRNSDLHVSSVCAQPWIPHLKSRLTY